MRIPARVVFSALMVGVVVPVCYLLTSNLSKNDKARCDQYTTASRYCTSTSHASHPISRALWDSHIQRSCDKLNMAEKEFLSSMFDHLLVDDENKLLYCQIPKVASTTWRRIFIVLSGKADITDPMAMTKDEVHYKYDKHLTYLSDFPHDEISFRLKNYFKFLFVREPFERLLSAFRNKFVKNSNVTRYFDFKKTFGRKIIDKYRVGSSTVQSGDGLNVKFEEFVKYLTDPNTTIVMNEHWEQFYKLCHPCLVKYDFIGKLNTIEEDSKYILEYNSLESKVKFLSRTGSGYGDKKTEFYMSQFYSQISKSLLMKLYRMYYPDFLIFNFTVPDSIRYMIS